MEVSAEQAQCMSAGIDARISRQGEGLPPTPSCLRPEIPEASGVATFCQPSKPRPRDLARLWEPLRGAQLAIVAWDMQNIAKQPQANQRLRAVPQDRLRHPLDLPACQQFGHDTTGSLVSASIASRRL